VIFKVWYKVRYDTWFSVKVLSREKRDSVPDRSVTTPTTPGCEPYGY
jgi:hypothetical protein